MMLALQRRQHLPYPHTTNTSSLPPSPPHSQSLSFDELSQQLSTLSAQGFYNNQKLLNDYLESQQQQSFATQTPVIVNNDLASDAGQFMTDAYAFSNPAIRIQQSTPTPQPSSFNQQPMLATSSNNWSSFADNGQMDTQSLQTPVQNRAGRGHQRASSSSSIGSNGSQFQAVNATTGYPSFSNHLPTPTHTPTQDSFLNQNFNNNNTNFPPNTSGLETTMAAHLSMKQALLDQHAPDDDLPGFGHSARHSVSSYGQDSPATPLTQQGDDFEDRLKAPTDMRPVPKFERTHTDVELDNLYNSGMVAQIPYTAAQVNPSSGSLLLSPWRPGNSAGNNVAMRNALQAAENARSQSPSSSISRGVSPFRQNSPYHAPGNSFNSPRMRTAAQAREAQKAEADAYAMKQMPQNEGSHPKTISPKEAMLDYRETDEDSKMPLFPESGASEYESQYNGGNQYSNATQSNFDTTSAQKFRQDSWATTPQFSSTFSTSTSGPQPPQSSFNFVPPSISGNMHGLPFATSQYRATPNMPATSEPTPEFPAHLTSMESSASEAGPESSQVSNEAVQKPAATTADSGTYTCTYHGCTLRFETPQKLQKHKRDGHRNNPNAPPSVGNGMTSAALLERNSQAGPHKCERINPTTGKPCNTIFSRPYDLTRHEDTIHNARKQKVRCALCVEEKTFSRNDALTRHMRVCHPEIDFPGKHKRRGGSHD